MRLPLSVTKITCCGPDGPSLICALPLAMASTTVRVEAEDQARCVTAVIDGGHLRADIDRSMVRMALFAPLLLFPSVRLACW